MNYYTVLEFNLNDDPTNEVNTSCQIGDLIYYTTLDESGGFSTGGYINLGTVAKIKRRQVIGDNIMNIPGSTHDHENNKIIVDLGTNELVAQNIVNSIPTDQKLYIMFGKNNIVNATNMMGYYAEAQFLNNSKEEAKLLTVGSEIAISSK